MDLRRLHRTRKDRCAAQGSLERTGRVSRVGKKTLKVHVRDTGGKGKGEGGEVSSVRGYRGTHPDDKDLQRGMGNVVSGFDERGPDFGKGTLHLGGRVSSDDDLKGDSTSVDWGGRARWGGKSEKSRATSLREV